MKTLKELNEELDAFNATLNDENEDTPELLAEQERLLNAIIAAEGADLGALSAKQLLVHFNKRAPSEHMAAWKGSKAALIGKIKQLPPLAAPSPTPAPEPTSAAAGEPEAFSAASYAAAHGLDGRELRKKLRAAGLKAPYTLADVEKVVGA
jgi:hypothetical protein